MTDAAKHAVRSRAWAALRAAGAARFPGVEGRIPNFVGAEAAAAAWAAHPWFAAARAFKVNPDSPARPLRAAILRSERLLVVATPRLTAAEPFFVLDPARIPPSAWWEASSQAGAARWGVPCAADALPPIDFIAIGAVALSPDGARVGKGGGFAELEWALLHEHAKVGPGTRVVSLAHPAQVCAPGEIPMDSHDLPLDAYALPTGVVEVAAPLPRPAGVDPARLQPGQRATIPALAGR